MARTKMRVVATLTTLPGREALLARTLRSLFVQSRPLDHVYLWLPAGHEFSSLPTLQRSDLEVAVTPDLGPATKLLPALNREGDAETILITVDDDVEYPPALVAKLLEAAALFPDSAIGFTGWQLIDRRGVATVRHYNQQLPYSGFVHAVNVLEGTRGVLYRRGMFAEDVLGHLTSLSAFRYHDDILFGGYLASRSIPRLVRWFDRVPRGLQERWAVGCQDSGLHMLEDWYALGRQCWDYWGSAFASERERLEQAAVGRRLHVDYRVADQRITVEWAEETRIDHGSDEPSSRTAGPASSWAASSFREVLARARIARGEELPALVAECLRLGQPGSIISLEVEISGDAGAPSPSGSALAPRDPIARLCATAFAVSGRCATDTQLPGVRMTVMSNGPTCSVVAIKSPNPGPELTL